MGVQVHARLWRAQGEIDPTYFKDPATGARYVVWKQDGNSCGHPTPIFAAPVSANGTSIDVQGTVVLVSNDQPWEGPLTEAPWLVRQGQFVYLFYSGNAYDQPSYAIGVARAATVAGPWTKLSVPSNPVLRSAPGAGSAGSPLHYGPGHCSIVACRGGGEAGWAIVYAAEQPGGGARNLMLDAVTWGADSWPRVGVAGVPSNTSQPLPCQ